MIVSDLRSIAKDFTKSTSEFHLQKLRMQKIGVRSNDVFTMQSEIIDNIVLENLLKAQNQLDNSDPVKCPYWTSQESLDRFISKIIING